mmetsp:Transcript_17059/g.23592  ORF Transcript_17059/g.23592 Transcript_17059/m.23592 type:complete len:85 (+) Transcript_17059:105-359(+)
MKHVRRGFIDVVRREGPLKLITPKLAELRAAGNPEFDLEFFKANTSHHGAGGVEEKMFWEVFEAFTTEEKELYCRFACGRKRLP